MKRLILILLVAVNIHALTEQEKRGQQIYRTGESPSGATITALVGEESMPVPASVLPCASCHGRDGRGKAEGGIKPSNLQWDVLTKPYEVGPRKHPPYTPATLRRAITTGLDPAKQKLHPAMPRYQMTLGDAEDLVAYLQKIGTDRDPGLTDDAIRLGVLLPPDGRESDAIRQALTEELANVDLFGRRVELRFNATEVFAIAAAYIVGRESEVAKQIAEQRVPTIAAFSLRGPEADRYLFHLLPRLEEQALALLREVKDEPIRIEYDQNTADVAARVARHAGERIREDATNVLYLKDVVATENAKTLLVPALFASPAIFESKAKVLVALPSAVANPTRAAALASARLMVRALERAGRDVDRESLVDVLESFRREETGLVPPVTWTKTSHVGIRDCTILRVENGRLVPR